MKEAAPFVIRLCFTLFLNAQVPKSTNLATGGLTSEIDTIKRIAPNRSNLDQFNRAESIISSKKQVLNELEHAVHNNTQIQVSFLNRLSTTEELMLLTGADKLSAQKLLMELENNVQSGAITLPNSLSQLPPKNQ